MLVQIRDGLMDGLSCILETTVNQLDILWKGVNDWKLKHGKVTLRGWLSAALQNPINVFSQTSLTCWQPESVNESETEESGF